MYVLKNGGKFIGVDSASGGYPFETDFYSCRIFVTLKEAKDYNNTFNNEYNVYRLNIKTIQVD